MKKLYLRLIKMCVLTAIVALYSSTVYAQELNTQNTPPEYPTKANTGNAVLDQQNYENALIQYQNEKEALATYYRSQQSGTSVNLEDNSGNSYSPESVNCLIPRDNTWTAIARNDDGSTASIPLGFTFTLYGTDYTSLYINTNGNVTFTAPLGTYSASGFPLSGTPMVAPFWADVDTRNPSCGQAYYKVYSDSIVVLWENVGYYDEHCDLVSTFELILRSGVVQGLGGNGNVAFLYGDMNWTTGDASSGTGGFGGVPATVGINHGNGTNFVQVGRFDANSSIYDGPGGNNDGIHYLDDKCYGFNASSSSLNLPPTFSGLPTANTINLMAGQSVTLNISAIGPEVGQTVTTTLDAGGLCGVSSVINNGANSTTALTVTGMPCNVGSNVITLTAVDNGTPAGTTVVNLTVNVVLPIYDIADVRTNDINGEPDSTGVTCGLRGTVTSIDFDGDAGLNFFIHDGTGGISIYNSVDVDGYVVNVGDSIYVEGDIGHYNGLTQLYVSSISVISSGHTVKLPTVVTTLDENSESDLVRINGLTLVNPSQWPSSGFTANVDVTNGANTMKVRIMNVTDIDGSPAPTGQFDLIGLGSQWDNSSPYFDGYQIQPRSTADILTTTTIPCAATASFTLYGLNRLWVNAGANDRNMFYHGVTQWKRMRVKVTGGVGPYTYSWSNNMGYQAKPAHVPEQQYIFEPLGPSYMVCEITDVGAGCTFKDSVFVDWTDVYYCGDPTEYWKLKMCQGGANLCMPWNQAKAAILAGTATLGDCLVPKAILNANSIDFKVYPNPTSGLLTINFTASTEALASIQVLDVHGRVLLAQEVETQNGLVESYLDLNGLANGMYFIRLVTENATSTQRVQVAK